ncbi:MAG: Type 1 glutamine amidotransferase-like domain-containing protein [Patescibacteria group bacterium]|nr:Type 1 glutamine amidotransferase-like domain-containing protein [Patescibacteria group bacterium]
MKLFLYSGGSREQNEEMNQSLVKQLPLDSTFCFIPSQSDKTRKYFEEFKAWFGYCGYENFKYFDLDEEYDETKLLEVQESDAIYLSGGNTFHFLYNIKMRGFDKFLRLFVQRGSILIGLSAGSYIMTPSIAYTVEYHRWKGDFEELNVDKINDFKAVGLVDFEIVPHFDHEDKRDFTEKYKKTTRNMIYGMYDGSGIIVKDKKIEFVGNIVEL